MTESAPQPLHTTALHDWHVDHGGRMVDFAGWSLPVFYETGAIDEHHATRRSVGLFDIDHMGQITVAGPGAVDAVDRLVTSDIVGLQVGAARYGLLCAEDGGVIDDVIVYRTEVETYMVVVNAANRETDFAHITASTSGVDVVDRSDELAMIAVQGPEGIALLDACTGGAASATERFHSSPVALFGQTALFGRTGYTGEDGGELYISGDVTAVWTGLIAAGADHGIDVTAVGLGARDSLRFEPGYPLYGHELSRLINPFEARLSWAVDLDGADFIGRDALVAIKEAGVARRLETIVLDERGVAREGAHVLDVDGDELGVVVSGMFCPTVDLFAANVFLPRSHGAVDTDVIVDIRGRTKRAHVATRPLYRRT